MMFCNQLLEILKVQLLIQILLLICLTQLLTKERLTTQMILMEWHSMK